MIIGAVFHTTIRLAICHAATATFFFNGRCREDIAGVEPRGLYNLIEFIIYDQELKGYITLEEVMKITYLR